MSTVFPDINLSNTQKLDYSKLNILNNKMFVKRDDLIHPIISGNKWRKLKFNVEYCKQYGYSGIVTFGGAFSNHLIATAEACRVFGLNSIGYVRGEELNPFSNKILTECHHRGMELIFINRNKYKEIKRKLGNEIDNKKFYTIPEGGAGYLGIKGCMEILLETDNDFDWVVIAQGTTTTSLGVLLSLPSKSKLLVVPALKGFDAVSEMKEQLKLSNYSTKFIESKMSQLRVADTYHFGGFSKTTPILLDFIKDFSNKNNLRIDSTYNGKALYALEDIAISEKWSNQKILYIHTGGYE